MDALLLLFLEEAVASLHRRRSYRSSTALPAIPRLYSLFATSAIELERGLQFDLRMKPSTGNHLDQSRQALRGRTVRNFVEQNKPVKARAAGSHKRGRVKGGLGGRRHAVEYAHPTRRDHLHRGPERIAAQRFENQIIRTKLGGPRDIEQREGRILRQGNLNPEVEIYRYVTEGSFDAYMWQTLETKARFIQQVMSGQPSVRTAEDLEGGALTYAEIKAIASGNPAVMEKVKIEIEIRKLDQLRAVHLNQQHSIRWQLRNLPEKIEDARETIEHLHADIATRDAHDGEDFTMIVGKQVFSGKGAREEASRALTRAVLSRRDDYAPRLRARFRGFEILSRDQPGASVPDLFIRGAGTYSGHINADNPSGTMQSIEHTLRALDKAAENERRQAERLRKR